MNFESIRVPYWGVDEVLSWVAAAGFKEFCPVFKVAYRHLSICFTKDLLDHVKILILIWFYSSPFKECGVDGDLLLMLRWILEL